MPPRIGKTVTEGRSSVRGLFAGAWAFRGKTLAFVVDRGLVAVGVGAAIGSAVFAGFMISYDSHPLYFAGADNQGRFGLRPLKRRHQWSIGIGPAENRRIDNSVTGSIFRGEMGATDAASLFDEGNAIPGGMITETYVLRFVHEGVALLQGDQGFYVARRGSTLPDAGRILSIERRGDKWVVVTEKGTVLEQTLQ